MQVKHKVTLQIDKLNNTFQIYAANFFQTNP